MTSPWKAINPIRTSRRPWRCDAGAGGTCHRVATISSYASSACIWQWGAAMRRVIFNQKGGVGKSSIACNLAAISAAQGYRTLLIDLDAQANSSQYLTGLTGADIPTGIAEFFHLILSSGIAAKKARPQ